VETPRTIFRVGDGVRVQQPCLTDCINRDYLDLGLEGCVRCTDENGDIGVNFGMCPVEGTWIKKENLVHLELVYESDGLDRLDSKHLPEQRRKAAESLEIEDMKSLNAVYFTRWRNTEITPDQCQQWHYLVQILRHVGVEAHEMFMRELPDDEGALPTALDADEVSCSVDRYIPLRVASIDTERLQDSKHLEGSCFSYVLSNTEEVPRPSELVAIVTRVRFPQVGLPHQEKGIVVLKNSSATEGCTGHGYWLFPRLNIFDGNTLADQGEVHQWRVGDYISVYLGPLARTPQTVEQMLEDFGSLSEDLRADGPRGRMPINVPKYPAAFPVPIPHPETGELIAPIPEGRLSHVQRQIARNLIGWIQDTRRNQQMRGELNQLQINRLIAEMTERSEPEERIRDATEQLGSFLTQLTEESERRSDDECQIDLIVERSLSDDHLIQTLVRYGATPYQIDVALCARNDTAAIPAWDRAAYGFLPERQPLEEPGRQE